MLTTYPLQLPEGHIRVGDAERQAAAGQLQDHFAAGRLTWEELDERLGQAWAARIGGDLSVLFADLPAPVAAKAAARRRFSRSGRVDPRLVLLLLFAVGLVVATRGFILLPVAWWFFAGRGRHHRRHGRSGDARRGRYDYPDHRNAWS